MAKRTSRSSIHRQQRTANSRAFGVGLVGIAVLVVGFLALVTLGNQTAPPLAMTLEPEIVANLTRLPEATPLTGEVAARWEEFRALVDACGDYGPERREQMHQHIDWLIDPSSIPPDLIIALGTNPTGKLIFGMATYTSSEWRLGGRQPDSCLVPIGRALDDLLVAAGEQPFGLYGPVPDS